MYIFIKSSAPYKIDIDLSLPTATANLHIFYVMLPVPYPTDRRGNCELILVTEASYSIRKL